MNIALSFVVITLGCVAFATGQEARSGKPNIVSNPQGREWYDGIREGRGAEVAYELRNDAVVMLASQELEPGDAYRLVFTPPGGSAMSPQRWTIRRTERGYDELYEMMTHPNAMTGLSDGGAHVGTICDASFVTTS